MKALLQTVTGKTREWEQFNPVLPKGIVGVELREGKKRRIKIGDGKRTWSDTSLKPLCVEDIEGLLSEDLSLDIVFKVKDLQSGEAATIAKTGGTATRPEYTIGIPCGKDGTGIAFEGSFNTREELEKAIVNPSVGKGFMVLDDPDPENNGLYLWNESLKKFKNLGNIAGPRGLEGLCFWMTDTLLEKDADTEHVSPEPVSGREVKPGDLIMSTNDMSNGYIGKIVSVAVQNDVVVSYRGKLDGSKAVQADWAAEEGPAVILNKPDVNSRIVGEYRFLSVDLSDLEMARERLIKLEGQPLSITLYPELFAKKWVGADKQGTADWWYICDENGNRNVNGTYFLAEDPRGLFPRFAGKNSKKMITGTTPYDGKSVGTYQPQMLLRHKHTLTRYPTLDPGNSWYSTTVNNNNWVAGETEYTDTSISGIENRPGAISVNVYISY